jgi:hypothetical protein
MNWSDIAKIIGTAAPTVGTLLGGPAGAAVGALVASALGTANSPEAVNAALSANPTLVAKIQELQFNAKVELQRLAVTDAQNRLLAENAQWTAEAADRDSARQLAAKQPNDIVRPMITFILLIGALSIVGCIFAGLGGEALKDPLAVSIVSMLIGFWFSELKQATGFYFGMTKEGQKQSALITDFAVSPSIVTKPEK